MEDKQENLTAWLMFGLLVAFSAMLVGIHVMLAG